MGDGLRRPAENSSLGGGKRWVVGACAAALLADAEMATRIEAKLRDGLTPATVAP